MIPDKKGDGSGKVRSLNQAQLHVGPQPAPPKLEQDLVI